MEGLVAERAGLVDQGDARRVGEPGKIAGGRRLPMPTKQMSLDLKRAGGGDRHHLGSGVLGERRLSCGAPAKALALGGERLGPAVEHIRLHPGEEAVAVARNLVPFL